MIPLDTIIESDFDFIIKQNGQKNVGAQGHHKTLRIATVNSLPNQISPPSQLKDYRVARIFYPIILVSKYAGFCPVKIIKNPGGVILYEFKWFSVQFFVTLIWGILTGATAITWIVNAIFNVGWPVKV